MGLYCWCWFIGFSELLATPLKSGFNKSIVLNSDRIEAIQMASINVYKTIFIVNINGLFGHPFHCQRSDKTRAAVVEFPIKQSNKRGRTVRFVGRINVAKAL